MDPRRARLSPRCVRRLGRGGHGHAAARCCRAAAQRRPVDGARRPAQIQRRRHAERWHLGARLEREPDGLRRALDLDRPGAAALDQRRQHRPLRLARPERRRRDAAQQPVRRMARPVRHRQHPPGRLRHRLPPEAVLQLHLRAGAARRWRPVLATGPAPGLRPECEPCHRAQARRAACAQRVRRATAARPHSRRLVRHRGAPDHSHHARRQGARDPARRLRPDRRRADAVAAQRGGSACRQRTLRCRQPLAAGQLGPGE